MTRHPAARRVHHQHAEADDAFIARILELTAWAKAHARLLVIAITILVIGSAAGATYLRQQRVAKALAATGLNEVRQTAASGNTALAINDLEGFIARFDGTDASVEARLLLAQVYLQEGDAQKAIATVQPVAEDGSPMAGSAGLLLGAAYEANGDAEQAVAAYLRVADRSEMSFERNEALDQAARIRLEQDNATAAADLYQRLVDANASDAGQRAIYELRLAEARAMANRPN